MALFFVFKARRDTTAPGFNFLILLQRTILSEMSNYEIIPEVYITVKKKRRRLYGIKIALLVERLQIPSVVQWSPCYFSFVAVGAVQA